MKGWGNMSGENLVGKVLQNRYELLEVIGVGGMATVYKARCRLLNRYVAIKVLKDSLKTDYEMLKRFKIESRAAASLTHHNIVGIYDVGEEDGIDYIVMEYVDGITLKEYISRVGRLDWHRACDFAMQIGLALQCAHENNIVHRDIKPHNILVTRDNTIKVADFGIARAVSGETMVVGRETMGSVRYISPEQARGGYVDARSDVYSLGVVLYEMLTGQVPFDGDNPVSIAMMKLNEEPTPCRYINPDIPASVSEITMRAIAKEQHARYQTAIDMVTDLKEAVDGNYVLHASAEDMGAYRQENEQQEQTEYTGRRRTAERKKKKSGVNVKMIIIGALVLAAVLGVIVNLIMSGGAKEVEVPDLLGMTLEEAIAEARSYELEIDEDHIEYETSQDYPEGQIILQDPGANQYMKQNKKIKITISSGDKEGDIPVPKLTGRPIDDAKEALVKLKLKYETIEEASDSIAAGYVIKQSPSEGTKVTEGSSILLHVSTGANETVSVPKVTGETLATARKLIVAAGFKVSITERETQEPGEIGKVISQKPGEDSEAKQGSTITIVVGVEAKQQEDEPTPTPKPAQTATPKPTQTPAPATEEPAKRKTLSIQIPEDSPETVSVKVVANGKTIYEQTHNKSEGTIDIPVMAKNDATVEVYIDGKLAMTRVVNF